MLNSFLRFFSVISPAVVAVGAQAAFCCFASEVKRLFADRNEAAMCRVTSEQNKQKV